MTATRRGLLATLAAASGSAYALASCGQGIAPGSPSWKGLEHWYAEAGPVALTIEVVRLGAIGASVWLSGAALLQLLAHGLGSRRAQPWADAVSPRFLRDLARGTAGLAVTAGMIVPGLSASAGPAPGTAVMVPLDVRVPESTTTTQPIAESTPTTQPTFPSTATPAVPARPEGPEHDEVIVAPGESFWSIACEETGDDDPVRYWRSLIEANLDRLVDPGNPDLLYPGQTLQLPR